jgi:hypothetical protein
LNRLEYYSLVQINRRGKESGADGSEGRAKSKEFPFGCGLEERIGGPGPGRYFQYMRSKQCTPQFFSSQARHPGSEPSDPEEQKAWRMKADKFACDFLIMFRPEPDLYGEGQSYTYEYNWEAYLEFVQELQMSNKDIDRSRLEQMERMVHSWGVNEEKKNVLTEWRGRRRTLWSAEDKELASAEYAKHKKGKFGNDDDDAIDYGGIGMPSEKMTLRQTNEASKMISHSRELLTELNKLHGTPRDDEHAARGPSEPVRTIKFNEEFANKLAKLQPIDDDEESVGRTDGRHSELINREANVNAYLEEKDLSSDKTPVINKIRQHFRAICDGSSKDKKYNAPLLLVCGGPGNGKSKLVTTVDGISSLMNVGTQVKTSYLGVAAVNIGGSTLCSLFDIPTERRKGKDGVDFKKIILPWSDKKKRKFTKMYDIDKISCIVVDEISTVQPYVLAYLSARLVELLQSDKDFGGIAVVLYGDFDQLPPVGGVGNLAAATMKYEEQQQSSADIKRWDRSKHCVNVHNEGLRLFQKFLYFELTKQHRSKDPAHTEIINNMRRSGKVKMQDLKKCKLLNEEDVAGNGDFRFATTLVTGNQERHQIINHKAKDWASYHGTFLVRWLRKVDYRNWKGKPRSEEHIKHAMANNETFYELFVQGALGYLNHNINTSKGIPLANGTEIKYDSISFDDPDDEAEFHKHVSAHSPGATITLHKPPSAINVELFADWPGDSEEKKKENLLERKQWQHGSLAKDGRIVIPISTKYANCNEKEKTYLPPAYSTSRCKSTGVVRSGLPLYGMSTVPLQDHFCIEPGFCITVHKAQGRTIRRLILSISDHPHPKLRHKWEGLYVGTSRVEYSEHMRLLLKRGDWGTTKLLRDLERCKYGECFFKGYVQQPNQNGMRWNRQLARAAAEDTNLFEKKSKTKKKKKMK